MAAQVLMTRRARHERRTAPIWRLFPKARGQRVRRVCERLEECYGKPRFGNPRDPLDDLIYVILSNKTHPPSATAAFRRLKQLFPTWHDAVAARARRMRSALKPAGLSTIKTRQIRSALRQVRADFGGYTLAPLRRLSDSQVEDYLVSLRGVSQKVAKCVMMYTMDRAVLPVDVHVHRVASRLGWTMRKRADQCHEELELLIPPKRRFAFHVGCIAHGRACCRPRSPRCGTCCINRHCEYYRQIRPPDVR